MCLQRLGQRQYRKGTPPSTDVLFTSSFYTFSQKDVQPIGPYLLPQGQSDYLDTQISQSVDLRWADSSLSAEKRKEKLLNMLTSPIPSKLFKDMSILMVGTDLVANKNVSVHGSSLQLDAQRGFVDG